MFETMETAEMAGLVRRRDRVARRGWRCVGSDAVLAGESAAPVYDLGDGDEGAAGDVGAAGRSVSVSVSVSALAGEAVAGLRAAVGGLDGVDVDGLSDRALLDYAVELDATISAAKARLAQVLAKVEPRQAYLEDGCVTAASWWRAVTRRDHGAARTMIITARRLKDLPAVTAAWRDGRIGAAHADVIARAAIPRRRAEVCKVETTLVELAEQAAPRDVARACRAVGDAVDPDGSAGSDVIGDDNPGPDERRELFHHDTIDGLGDLRATLDPVTSFRLAALLTALSQPDPANTPEAEQRTPAQRRHDAFDRLLQAAEQHPDMASVQGARPHVHLLIDLFALLTAAGTAGAAGAGGTAGEQSDQAGDGDEDGADSGDGADSADMGAVAPSPATSSVIQTFDRDGQDGQDGQDGRGGPVRRREERHVTRRPAISLANGSRLTLARALTLLEDAKLTAVLMLGPFRPVGVGRTQRVLPAWLRPIMQLIHRHCRGPGCDRPTSWTDAAHIGDSWADGGPTELEQTLPECSGHHHILDVLGWTVDYDPDNAICTWTSPNGQTSITTHPPQP